MGEVIETKYDDVIRFFHEFEVNMTHIILVPSFNFI